MRLIRLLVIAGLMGCTVQKRDRAVAKMAQQQDLSMRIAEVNAHQLTSIGRDSIGNSYEIRIWPKGAFSFDVVEGFRGEAAMLSVKGNLGKVANLYTRENTDVKKVTRLNQQLKTRAAVKEKQVTTSRQPNLIMAIILLVGLALGYFIYKKLVGKSLIPW